MRTLSLSALASVGLAAVLAGCAQPSTAPATTTASTTKTTTAGGTTTTTTSTASANTRLVKSRDGKYDGEVVGTPKPGSKFAKLQIGMDFNEVSKLIGGPSSMDSHETGKRWIPFYFGNDARRMEVIYAGEGCLTFTGGNAWGGGGNELIRITADPTEALCKG